MKLRPLIRDRNDAMAGFDRSQGIGASVAAIAVGLSPWGTPFDLYMELIGQSAGKVDTAPMEWGRRLEPAVLGKYADETGARISGRQSLVRHPTLPFMYAHLDGRRGKRILIEAKTGLISRSSEWGEPGTDEIPVHYLIQCLHQLACVPEAQVVHVPVLFAGRRYQPYEVPRDREAIERLELGETDFWGYVERREPPPIDGSDGARDYLEAKYGDTDGRTIAADEGLADLLVAYMAHKATRQDAGAELDRLGNLIRARMGTAYRVVAPGVHATLSRVKGRRTTQWDQLVKALGITAAQVAEFTEVGAPRTSLRVEEA